MKCALSLKAGALGLSSLLVAVGPAGCAGDPAGRVMALPNAQVTALTADDVVRVMQRAGFSDQQILDLGTDLRNCIASCGAAQIRVGDKTEAIFAVNGKYLHASSRRRGSFIYDLEKRQFR